LQQASPLREPINLELLEITRSEEWAADLERYIGAEQ
jgi:ABC-type amino acid transport substrate-binding protein